MLQPLVVGLGRSGAGLHLRALARMAAAPGSRPMSLRPPVACDPRPGAGQGLDGVTVVGSIAEAAEAVPPTEAVVHLCTPPSVRVPVLTELAERGFTRFIVEKPLATDPLELDRIAGLRRRYGLDLDVVAHWLAAELTHELRCLVREGGLGPLLAIDVAQHKPRFLRSLTTTGHPTAFDVEIPHSLGLVLDLAGPAELLGAHWSDMHCDGAVLSRMGSAGLTLRHAGGVRTAIFSDLASPVQERSITLEFEHSTVTGHYPLSEHDDHAQLVISGDSPLRRVFRDDALTAFMRQTYHRLAEGRPAAFARHHDVTRLLCAAKDHCRTAESTGGPEQSADAAPSTDREGARAG